jgi:hypothetical protein
VKDIKNQYYFEWKLRKSREEEVERQRRTPWIDALQYLRTQRPPNLPLTADILRIALDVVFYILSEPLCFGLTAFALNHFAAFLDGHNYHSSKVILEALLCSIGAWVWIFLEGISASLYASSTHRMTLWFCQGIVNYSCPPHIFSTWLQRGASMVYKWDYTVSIKDRAWTYVRKWNGRENPQEFPPALFVAFVFFNWLCLLLCSSVETNLTLRMDSWWYIGLLAAYIVWVCNFLPLILFLACLDHVRELQFGRFTRLIIWAMGITLGVVATCWMCLQRWILCHIHPYAITIQEKNALQRADEWVHTWSAWSWGTVMDAIWYLVSFIWTFETKEEASDVTIPPVTGPVPAIWHWRYTNESSYCASGNGAGNWLFQGHVPPLGLILSLLSLLSLVWWIIRIATLQWRGRLTLQHYVSNGVDVVTLPFILATLWRLSECEGKVVELQKTGFFNRDFNDLSVPTTWEGCTESSFRPLVYCLALLGVRGMCRGFAILMEVRRSRGTLGRRYNEAYEWLYPPALLAWARVICTGTRKPVRRNAIDVR